MFASRKPTEVRSAVNRVQTLRIAAPAGRGSDFLRRHCGMSWSAQEFADVRSPIDERQDLGFVYVDENPFIAMSLPAVLGNPVFTEQEFVWLRFRMINLDPFSRHFMDRRTADFGQQFCHCWHIIRVFHRQPHVDTEHRIGPPSCRFGNRAEKYERPLPGPF